MSVSINSKQPKPPAITRGTPTTSIMNEVTTEKYADIDLDRIDLSKPACSVGSNNHI